MMTGAGWPGGHLAYGMGVGVDTTAFDGGPTDWTAVSARGEDGNHRVVAAGVTFAIFEGSSSEPHVLANRCTHRGGPLSEGELAEGCVRSPWHGSLFDVVDGHVVRGPASAPQPVYEVRPSRDGIEVRRNEPRAL